MKTKANGISINYQIDGPRRRAVADLLQFAAHQPVDVGRAGGRAEEDPTACCATTSAAMAARRRPTASTRSTMLAADVIGADGCARHQARAFRRHLDGRHDRARCWREQYRDRFDRIIPCDCGPASTPAGAQQWQERIELANDKGMEALADVTIPRWFPPEFVATKSPVLDKVRGMIERDAAPGLCRLRGGAVGLRPAAGAAGIAKPDAADRRHQGRHRRRDQGDQRRRCPARELVELEGAGHLSNLEQPQKFTQAIRDFIKAACSARPRRDLPLQRMPAPPLQTVTGAIYLIEQAARRARVNDRPVRSATGGYIMAVAKTEKHPSRRCPARRAS